MKSKNLMLTALLSLSSAVAFAQQYPLLWDNNTTDGVRTFTDRTVGIGPGTNAVPTDAILKVQSSFDPDNAGPDQPNVKIIRNFIIGFNQNYTEPNLIEAIKNTYTSWNLPPSANKGFVLTPTFNMGIGTANPADRLTVEGNIGFEMSNTAAFRNILGRSDQGGVNIVSSTDGTNGTGIRLFGKSHQTSPGAVQFISNGTAPANNSFNFLTYDNGGNWLSRLLIKGDGRVGIGTGSPIDRLTVNGNLGFEPQMDPNDGYRFIRGHAAQGLAVFANNELNDGGGIILHGNNGVGSGDVRFISGGALSGDVAFNFMQYNNAQYTSHVTIYKNGKMSIGAPLPTGPNAYDYKLYVKNGILTERVKVALSNDPSNWSDFVFDDDYKLMPLSEVESYIEENNHLPEIPSTKEVLKDGLDLAAMDAKLLQKVEELTLYVIQQQKEIEKLKRQTDK